MTVKTSHSGVFPLTTIRIYLILIFKLKEKKRFEEDNSFSSINKEFHYGMKKDWKA